MILAMGTFDGIHLGHQSLIKRLLEVKNTRYAGNATTALLSFYPHPAEVLISGMRVPRICTLWQTRERLDTLGVDLLVLCRFTDALSKLSAAEFLKSRVIDWLNTQHLILGPDAAVGRDREGDAAKIVKFMQAAGRSAEILEFLNIDSERASSRSIRKAIAAGDFVSTQKLLGRFFALEGYVIAGEKRGRKISYPTINLKPGQQVLPPVGVYATRTITSQGSFFSVTNIGYRPTFGGKALGVETHLLDFSGAELYGQRVQVQFFERIREELRFSSAQELRDQIAKDIAHARSVFKSKA